MKDPKEIAFVQLDILENWRFWNQFQTRGDYEGAGREVIAQANAMLAQDMVSNERAAALLNEAREFRLKKQQAGKAGGLAKARNREQPTDFQHKPKSPINQFLPPTPQELYDYAREKNLDEGYAREWFEMTVMDRNFKDKDGKPVKNWKRMLEGYVQSKTKQP